MSYSIIELVGICIGLPLAAAWGHEITHAIAAWVLGGTVHRINFYYLYVDFSFDRDAPIRRQLVFLSPTIVGIVLLPLLLVWWGGGVSALGVMALVSWTIYALRGGSPEEVSLSTIASDIQNTGE